MSEAEVKRYYSEWWENPRDIRKIVFESLNDYVWARIAPGQGKKALDLGSGHGRIVSYLLGQGYNVTALEFNEEFVTELKKRYPGVRVVSQDVRKMAINEKFDLTTCIELVQNLDTAELSSLLSGLSGMTQRLIVNISNRRSFHAWWLRFRKFQAPFVFTYTPGELESLLDEAGFDITHRRGIGLLTPVSLLKGFRFKIVPVWLARLVNKLEVLFPRVCHLYYVEAINRALKE